MSVPEHPLRSSDGPQLCRIALTGGPGGGKTTAADMLRREIGERVVVVPESATLLFGGGFPRCDEPEARRYVQRAIFHVQRNIEDLQSARFPKRVLLCDRGTVDGAAYWPADDPLDFFHEQGTTLERELRRYDAVLFFETAAVGGFSIETGNPQRTETNLEAVALDRRMRKLWSNHPNFILIHHNHSFMAKLFEALHVMGELIRRFVDDDREGTIPLETITRPSDEGPSAPAPSPDEETEAEAAEREEAGE